MSYKPEREDLNVSTKLTYLLIGGGIGAVLALLFAPKSGQELRGDIADATRKGIEKSRETAEHLQGATEGYYEVTREKASQLYNTAQDRAGDLTEKAKTAVAQRTNPISDAIDAGKKAYIQEKRHNESRAISEGRPSYPIEGNKDDEEKLKTGNKL